MDKKRIGDFIKNLRQDAGMSQEDLADALHISRSSISKWENGTLLPTTDNMHRLCKFFGVSFNELAYGEKANEDNLDDLDNITIDLIKKNNRKKYIIFDLLFIILLLIVAFLACYFISSYKSTKVYALVGEYEDNLYYEGSFIITKEQISLSIYNISKSEVDKLRLYYIKDNKEYLIIENGYDYINIKENTGYNEYFDINNIKTIVNNLYLDVYLTDEDMITIKLDTKLNYINDSIVYKKSSSATETDFLSDYLLDEELIECIKETFREEDGLYTYTLDDMVFGYSEESKILYLNKDDESWNYFLSLFKLFYSSNGENFSYNYYSNECSSGDCSNYETVNEKFWNYFNEIVKCS